MAIALIAHHVRGHNDENITIAIDEIIHRETALTKKISTRLIRHKTKASHDGGLHTSAFFTTRFLQIRQGSCE